MRSHNRRALSTKLHAEVFISYVMLCDWEKLPVTYDASGALPRYTDPRWNDYLANLYLATYRARYETRLPEHMRGAVLGTTSTESERAFQRVITRFREQTGHTPYVFEGSSVGADRFGILVSDR